MSYISREKIDYLSIGHRLRAYRIASSLKAEDVAECVAFLASGASDYITGQVIQVDGGMLM